MDKQLQYIKQYNLIEILDYIGCIKDKKKSTKTSLKYKCNCGIFIIKDNKYFNTFDNNDNGSVIDFIQNNILEERNFYKVKKWFNDNIQIIKDINIEYKQVYKKEEKTKNFYFEDIKKTFINENIRYINKDLFNNLISKNVIKYYYKYDLIKIPLFDNLDKNITGVLNINIKTSNKFLEKNSNKDLFFFGNKIVKYVMIFESFFDCLSYIELLKIKYNLDYNTILNNVFIIVSNGAISKNNLKQIETLLKNIKFYKIILCFDNDTAGVNFDNQIINLFENKTIDLIIKKSITKDYNEDLKMYYKEENNKVIENIL